MPADIGVAAAAAPFAGALVAVDNVFGRAHSGSQDADALSSSFCPLTAAAVVIADAAAAVDADAALPVMRPVSLPAAWPSPCAASGAAEISLLLAGPAVAAVGILVAAAMSAAAVAGGLGALRLRDSRSEAARCLAAGELHHKRHDSVSNSADLFGWNST